MIHNNFRRLLRRILSVGYSSGSSRPPSSNGIVDTTGYIETDNANSYAWKNAICAEIFDSRNITNKQVSTVFNTKLISGATCDTVYFLLPGSTASNEPDYTLGSFADSLMLTTSNSISENAILFTSTLTNPNETDVIFNELGLFLHFETNSSSYKWNDSFYMNMLLAKEILSTPITIPGYSSVTLTMDMFGDVTVTPPNNEVNTNE